MFWSVGKMKTIYLAFFSGSQQLKIELMHYASFGMIRAPKSEEYQFNKKAVIACPFFIILLCQIQDEK